MAKKAKLPQAVTLIREHATRKVDYSTEKSISYSQATNYLGCPFRWHLVYRENKQVYQPSIHTVFGTAFHETVQNWLTVLYEDSVKAANEINLHEYLQNKLTEIYKQELDKVDFNHFSTAEQLAEFYEDGCAILDYLQKNRAGYFSTKGWYLVGCEIPLSLPVVEGYEKVIFKGYLDLVMYHEPTNTYEIIDIKTSTKGWGVKEKGDELKAMQLLLYKEYFAKQFGVDKSSVKVKFLIVRRKAGENPYTGGKLSRVQEFIPPTGPKKTKAALEIVELFVTSCFTKGGQFFPKDHPKNISNDSCRWCPFRDNASCGMKK